MRKLFQCTLLACVFLTMMQATPTGRLVGGYDAEKGQFPYQVSLRFYNRYIYLSYYVCGGSIISQNFVLTAAHCVVSSQNIVYNASDITVRVGSIQRLSGGKVKSVQQIIVHEHYESNTNDIALLKLSSPLIFTDLIKAIPLTSSKTKKGVDVLVSGWGSLEINGEFSNTLQWTTLKSLSKKACAKALGIKTDALLCLAHDTGRGPCNADSGGPAVYKGKLIGVADTEHCGSSKPDGFVSVNYHRKWIKKHAGLK